MIISTVVPREIPTGETTLSVGGVMRFPVGCLSAAIRHPQIRTPCSARFSVLRRTSVCRRPPAEAVGGTLKRAPQNLVLINLHRSIEPTDRKRFPIRREREPENPIRLIRNRTNLC